MQEYVFYYARVSTKEQNPDRQIAEARAEGIPDDRIFIDFASGKDYNRPEYIRLTSLLRAGDTVVVSSLDRLGRNYRETVTQWQMLTKEIGVHIRVLDMPMLNGTGETGEVINDIIILLLSYVADKEYQSIRERQRAGIEAAKARGVYKGKPRIKIDPDRFGRLYGDIQSKRRTMTSVCNELGISRFTYYRIVEEYKTGSGRFAE